MTYKSAKRVLHIDLETYSDVNIKAAGLHKYMETAAFSIMLCAYAYDDEPVKVLDLMLNPEDCLTFELEIIPALKNQDILKCAHNAAFERTALGKAVAGRLGERVVATPLPPEDWADTMILALRNGLPASLDAVGQALGFPQDKLKDRRGKALINYFCKPCRATKVNGGRGRNLPQHALDKWAEFKEYCKQDVVTEQEIFKRLSWYPTTETEERIRCIDARVNERGVRYDRALANSAIAVNRQAIQELTTNQRALTGLDNPNSVAQLKGWLAERGVMAESLNKKVLAELLKTVKDPTVRQVLLNRQMLGKTSVKKYVTMNAAACDDDRIRNILQYYGAGRTGRWAGRLVQLQNLPQNHLNNIAAVRQLMLERDLESLELFYDNIPDVLSQLIRTAFIAEEGSRFLVADYHAIEAVCIAYLAQERWRLDVFSGDGKIYEASYAQAFNVPKESVKKGSPERQKGKIMELALGYGGGVNALITFGADKLGLTPEEMQELVDKWRRASPNVCALWREAERAAKAAITKKGVMFKMKCGAGYLCCKNQLLLKLPSGRHLSYWQPEIIDGAITFMATSQKTGKWERSSTWGGKLVENIVQAYARDILGEAMLRLYDAGFKICFHVHDEIITEMPAPYTWQNQAEIMGAPVSWAPNLNKYLHADGYETPFYMKD